MPAGGARRAAAGGWGPAARCAGTIAQAAGVMRPRSHTSPATAAAAAAHGALTRGTVARAGSSRSHGAHSSSCCTVSRGLQEGGGAGGAAALLPWAESGACMAICSASKRAPIARAAARNSPCQPATCGRWEFLPTCFTLSHPCSRQHGALNRQAGRPQRPSCAVWRAAAPRLSLQAATSARGSRDRRRVPGQPQPLCGQGSGATGQEFCRPPGGRLPCGSTLTGRLSRGSQRQRPAPPSRPPPPRRACAGARACRRPAQTPQTPLCAAHAAGEALSHGGGGQRGRRQRGRGGSTQRDVRRVVGAAAGPGGRGVDAAGRLRQLGAGHGPEPGASACVVAGRAR